VEDFKPIIEILDDRFEIPQLEVERRIAALLPFDYHESDKEYPVLYLQDGQNLFNPEAPYGNWAIDDSLAELAIEGHHQVIIIAIDHGDDARILEYSPYYHPRFGEGKGKSYLNFLIEILIPFVESKYRVSRLAKDRGIGGSSMGGLISLYSGLAFPYIFGKMMIFSPSLWLSPMIYFDAEKYKPELEARVYLFAGGKESKFQLPNIKRLSKIIQPLLENSDQAYFHRSIDKEANHGEFYWSIEFPKAIKWLYFNN
jgi:predicted alpha/beta superfamily hydrolase